MYDAVSSVCSSSVYNVGHCVMSYVAVVNVRHLRLYHRQTVSAEGTWQTCCNIVVITVHRCFILL